MFTRSVLTKSFYYGKNLVRYNSYMRNRNEFRRREFNSNEPTVIDIIERYEIKDKKDYEGLKEELICQFDNKISKTNVDSIIINGFTITKKYDLAMNYVKLMKENKAELHLATIGKIFRLYHSILSEENVITQNDENEIIKLYNDVKAKYPVLDTITNDAIIAALSLTKHWEKCLALLDEIKICSTPTISAYDYIASAAFKNGQNKIGWDLLDEVIAKGRDPPQSPLVEYVKGINVKNPKATTALEHLLNFLGNNDVICNSDLITEIQHSYKKLGAQPQLTNLTYKGFCPKCKKSLHQINLNVKEFETLKTAFFNKVIIGKDVFRKTTPNELRSFKEFIDRNKKYDVVIDGLNVAYSAGVQKSVDLTASFVAAVVKHYINSGKKVLVLGRSHMKKWPQRHMDYIMRNAETFFTQNISQDDPFLLYCALHSGLNTIIVTRDLMRSHLYLLKDVHHKRLFSRWLSQSQHQFQRILNDGRVVIKNPPPFLRTTQKIDSTWHIPYSDNEENTNNWLCLQL